MSNENRFPENKEDSAKTTATATERSKEKASVTTLDDLRQLWTQTHGQPIRHSAPDMEPIICQVCYTSELVIRDLQPRQTDNIHVLQDRDTSSPENNRNPEANPTASSPVTHEIPYEEATESRNPSSTQDHDHEFANQEDAVLLPCGHITCKICIQFWKDQCHGRKFTCPFCRLHLDPPRCDKHRMASIISLADTDLSIDQIEAQGDKHSTVARYCSACHGERDPVYRESFLAWEHQMRLKGLL